jgi:thiamine pyrophosphokinase
MRAIIIAGGRTPGNKDWQRWVRDGDWIVGADGGAARALSWGLIPHIVIGDMDSLPEDARTELVAQGCQFVVHPRAKDETDLELALTYAVQQRAREIVILGALGGRLDHTLANLLLMALPKLDGVPVCIVDANEEAMVVRSGEAVTLEGSPSDLVSLLPLGGDVQGVTTAGLAWPLEGGTLQFGFSRGVSNEMTGATARVAVEDGFLLVVHRLAPERREELAE